VTARRHRARTAVAVVAAVVAGVAVHVLAAGGTSVVVDRYLRAARADDAAGVLAAAARGDCTTVAAAYRGATAGPVLPLRRPPVAADVTRAAADCRDLARVDALAASGRRDEALNAYLEFRRVHRFSPLYGHVPDRVGKVLRAGRLTPARETCVRLAQVSAPGDVPAPADTMPRLLTTCGELLAASRDKNNRERDLGQSLLRTVRREYAGSPEAPRAEALEAALLVQPPDARLTIGPPEPVPGGPAGRGWMQVVYQNHTPGIMTLAISGPGGGRVVELPACSTCPELDGNADCTPRGHTAVVTLPAGTYRVWVLLTEPEWGWTWSGTWRLGPGAYGDCLAHRT
jgi:hypothetical protein